MKKELFQIAIDGPSGAGKSTVAKAIAASMGIVYVDTGALYRTVGYYVRSKGVDPADESGVEALLPDITIEVKYENGVQCVYLNGENLGDKIREPEISMYASTVSKNPAVRAFLLETQKEIARVNSVVMDGRDIGTVILPNAEVKIFLTASNECRARRRCEELRAKGTDVTFEEVLADMIARDEQDRSRDVAPAIPAEDAILLDNSELSFEETLAKARRIIDTGLAKKKDKRSGFYKFFYYPLAPVFRFFLRMKVVGLENEPKDGGFLVCANHIAASDAIVLCAALRKHQPCLMAKAELFKVPLLAGLLRRLGAYPVSRGMGDVGAVKTSIRYLEEGRCVGMFPQGTRCPGVDPRTTPVKNGVAMIACRAGASVLPVYIHTEGNVTKFFKKRTVIIGKPISCKEFDYDHEKAGEYARISNMIFDRICTLGEEYKSQCNRK